MNLRVTPLKGLLAHASHVEMLPWSDQDSVTISTDTSLPSGTILILSNGLNGRNIVVIINTGMLTDLTQDFASAPGAS